MTTNYHTPMAGSDLPSFLTSLNVRLSDLDSGISGLVTSGATTTISGTSGESLADRDACYIAADGKIYALDPDATPSAAGAVRGFVTSTVNADESVNLVIGGLLDGFTGLTAGLPVYVDTLAGSITQTKPTATLDGGQIAVMTLGIAQDTDSIRVMPQPVQYVNRAALDDDETLVIEHYGDAEIHQREVYAYITAVQAQNIAVQYSSANQDEDVGLAVRSVDTYTGDQCTGGTASAQAHASGGFEPAKAFDDDTGTKWAALLDGSKWLKYDRGASNEITARQYTVTASSDAADQSPAAWTFEGSNNDADWDTLDTVSGETGWSVSEKRTFQFTNPQSYRYYRWVFTATDGSIVVSVGEAEIMSADTFANENEKLAQTFSLASETELDSVNLWMKKEGSPTGTLTLRIETLSAGEPTGTLANVNASATVSESGIGSSYENVTFDFATDFTLSAGDYALVLSTSRSYSENDYVVWGADGSTPSYGDGEMFNYDGSSWTAESKDACFAVYEPATTYSSRVSVDHWASSYADVVNRYGDTSAQDVSTKTTFKCVADAGLDDVTCVVVLP